MAAKNGNRKFGITAHVAAEVMVTIEAATLDEALVKSKAMKLRDFITVKGEEWDSRLVISQIWMQNMTCNL